MKSPSPFSHISQHLRTRSTGFTLVEIMVALAAGLALITAIIVVQLNMTRQNTRITDSGVRNNEARAAIDAINRELASSGFLSSGVGPLCDVTLAFNNNLAAANQYFTLDNVTTFNGGAGVSLPIATGLPAFNYPPAPLPPNGNRSDVLVVRTTRDAAQFNSTTFPRATAIQAAGPTPFTTGVFNVSFSVPSVLPATACNSFNNNVPAVVAPATNMALVFLGLGTIDPVPKLCMRVPVIGSNCAINPLQITTGIGTANTMPPNLYAGFSAQLVNFGLPPATADVLSDLNLNGGNLLALGSSAVPANPLALTQQTWVYFVRYATDPTSGALDTFPTLSKVMVNSLTDQVQLATLQDVAAGVVSLQVNFGVNDGTCGTGLVCRYMTGAQVRAANSVAYTAAAVLSARVMVLTRSLYPDPTSASAAGASRYESPSQLNLNTQFPNSAPTPGNLYVDYKVSPTERVYHYVAQETEVALRNGQWNAMWISGQMQWK